MSTSPRDRIRHLRLARALAGTDLEGIGLIEEIGSISKLASHYAEEHHGEGASLTVLEDAFRTIARHSKTALKHCSAVTEAAQAFIYDLDVPEFDSQIDEDEDTEDCGDDEDEADTEEADTASAEPARCVQRKTSRRHR